MVGKVFLRLWSSAMLIRRIQPSDNLEVASIIRTVMTEFGAVGAGFSIEDAEVDCMYESYTEPRTRFYVLDNKRALLGCGGIAPLAGGDPETCELKKMYFQPAARGQGYGRLLVETLLQDACRLGFRKVYIETLQSMVAANLLYQKLGFERLDRGLGNTGHCGCDTFYAMELPPVELDPSLLV